MFLAVPHPRYSGQSSQASDCTHSQTFTCRNSTTSLLTQSKKQLKNLKSIENGFYVANLYQRFELIDKVLFYLVLINCVGIAAYVQLELRMITPMHFNQHMDTFADPVQLEQAKYYSQYLLHANCILGLLSILASFLRHRLQTAYHTVQKKQTQPINQLYQILFITIQPYPFLDDTYVHLPLEQSFQGIIHIKLNLLMVIASILKTLLLVRFIFWHDLCRYLIDIRSRKFFRPSYNRICKIYSCENNYMHIMKCLFRENFIVFIGGFYLICMTVCAYCLRIVESHFDGRFVNMLNCMWFTLLSMTTVGYGDLWVSTPIGIVLDGFLMFSGVVIVSLLVSSLNGLFTMGYRERRSLTLIKRLKDKAQLKEIASVFIARCLQRNWIQKKTGKRLKVSQEQRIYCRLFNQLRMTLKCGKQKQLNLYRDMSNQFQSLKLQLQQLMDTCEEDINCLSEKQMLTLNRDSKRGSESVRNRSSSYYNMIKMKSRDSRVSIMQPIFGRGGGVIPEEWVNQLRLSKENCGEKESSSEEGEENKDREEKEEKKGEEEHREEKEEHREQKQEKNKIQQSRQVIRGARGIQSQSGLGLGRGNRNSLSRFSNNINVNYRQEKQIQVDSVEL